MTDSPGETPLRRPSRLTRSLKWLGISLVVLLILLVTAYLAGPPLVARFAPQFAQRLGVKSIEVRIGYPRLDGLTIERLVLIGDDFSLSGENADVRYEFSQLLTGHIESIVFKSLRVSVNSAATPGDPKPPPSTDQIFPMTPFGQLSVEHLTVEFPDTGFVGVGHADLGDGTLAFSLQGVEPEAASHFTIAANMSHEGVFHARFGERDNSDIEFLTMRGAIADVSLSIEGQFQAEGYVLDLASSIAGLPPGTGTIMGEFETRIAWPLPEVLAWQDISATLPTVSVNWQSADGDVELKAVSGSVEVDRGNIAAILAGTVLARLDDYTVTLQLPEKYQLNFQASTVTGASGLGLRANNTDSSLKAKIRSFSIDTAQGTKIKVDADVDASSTTLRVGGRLIADLALTKAQPTLGGGHLNFKGTANFSDLAYQSDVQATFDIAGDQLKAAGQLASGIVDKAPFGLEYDLASGAGHFGATSTLKFRQPFAAAVVPGWTKTYDLDSGEIDAALKLNWQSIETMAVALTLTLNGVSGHYDSYQATGISGELAFTAPNLAGSETWELQESLVQLEHVDVGIPVDALALNLSWSGNLVNVTAASASVLGGQATATPFVYDLATGSSTLELNLQSVDLAAVLALEGDDIVGSGNLSGVLPVTVSNNRALIVGGSMAAAPPGGTIRLTPTISGPSGQPGLDFALLALKDFSYSELRTEINYAENGDLQLGVRLKGRNPAIEGGRPIHYNLNISENIPTLLESLRLQDQVTERIEAEAKK